MLRRLASSVWSVCLLIVILLVSALPPAPLRAAPLPTAPTATTQLYLPLIAKAFGPPEFQISSPTAGATVAGPSLVVAQAIYSGSVTSVAFKAGDLALGTDSTPAD